MTTNRSSTDSVYKKFTYFETVFVGLFSFLCFCCCSLEFWCFSPEFVLSRKNLSDCCGFDLPFDDFPDFCTRFGSDSVSFISISSGSMYYSVDHTWKNRINTELVRGLYFWKWISSSIESTLLTNSPSSSSGSELISSSLSLDVSFSVLKSLRVEE